MMYRLTVDFEQPSNRGAGTVARMILGAWRDLLVTPELPRLEQVDQYGYAELLEDLPS